MKYNPFRILLLLVSTMMALPFSAKTTAEDVTIQYSYGDNYYVDCNGNALSFKIYWDAIVQNSLTAIGGSLTQEAFESGWIFDGYSGDGSNLTQYSNKNQVMSQPIGSVAYYESGVKALQWIIETDELISLYYQGMVDVQTGMLTVPLTTYVKLQGSPNVWIKLTIPASSIRFATGSIGGKKYGKWFLLNSNATGAREIHACTSEPNEQNDDCSYVFNILSAFNNSTIQLSINNKTSFSTFSSSAESLFRFTTPAMSKGNASFNADSNGCWTVTGASGSTYTLQVSSDKMTIQTTRGVPIVKLVSDYGDVASIVEYQQNEVAFDILNYAGHNQIGSHETFTAYLEIVVESCYDLIVTDNSQYFNVRFLRPVDMAATNGVSLTDKGDFYTANVMDLVSLTDWRGDDFTFSSAIIDNDGGLDEVNYVTYDSPHYINYYEVRVTADVSKAYADVSGMDYDLYYNDSEITWNGSKLVGGTITYKSNTLPTKDFHIYVPITLSYKWGYNTQQVLGVITVNHYTAADVDVDFSYEQDYYVDCEGDFLSYTLSWDGIATKSLSALGEGLSQKDLENGWIFDGYNGDGSILTQYSEKNKAMPQPIGQVVYYDKQALVWRIDASTQMNLINEGKVDRTTGLSTVDFTTYLKLQGSPNVWVKLTIPAGSIHFATGSVGTNKLTHYWYALNSSSNGSKEMHANVTVPNTQNDDCAFKYDILNCFDRAEVEISVNNAFSSFNSMATTSFGFTTPSTSKGNAEFNADSNGRWTVTGASGSTYTLRVSSDKMSIQTTGGVTIVRLTGENNNIAEYQQNTTALDILNYAGHNQLGSRETFTAYMEMVVGSCYDLLVTDNSQYFNVRFLRPVDMTATTGVTITDKGNTYTANVMELISLTDWREASFTSSNAITDNNTNDGIQYASPHYINYYGVSVTADVSKAYADVSGMDYNLNYKDSEITWNGSKLVGGTITYKSNTLPSKDFHIYVPILINYKWGRNTQQVWGVITVNHETTPSYSLTISASGNGSVSYSGNSIRNGNREFTVGQGTNATISISADNGYRVASLKVNNQEVASHSTISSYTVSNITANTSVSVTFEQIPVTTYTLSIQSGSGGSVYYNSTTISNTTRSFSVESGSSATISITPNSGYKLSKLTVNGTDRTSQVSNNQYTISNITANTNVVVTFETINYTLSIQSESGGSVSYNGTTITNTTRTFTVTEGTSATITITPNTGYMLSKLMVNGINVASSVSNNQYTIRNISANTVVVVSFTQITYTLSLQASGSGTVVYNSTSIKNTTRSFTVNHGTSATLTITPDSGYRLASLTVNGTNVTSSVKNNRYTLSSITTNTSVVATFEQITYTLSVQASGNGIVTYNNTSVKNTTRTFTVNHGASATLTITPDAGYQLASLTVNGTNVTTKVSNNSYNISSITANTTVSATFEAISSTTYTLSIQASGNGSVIYNGTNTVRGGSKTFFTVNEGSNALLTFSPDSGYKIASVKVNYTDVTSKVKNNQYTISNITANTTVAVTFTQITYNVNVQASGDGTVTYSGTSVKNGTQAFTVNHGSSATLTLKPDSGCRLASLAVNGTDVTEKVLNSQYTISNITVTTYVVATFEKIPITSYTLFIQSGSGGSVSYNGIAINNTTKTYTIAEGASATITITPDSGYQLASLTVNGTDVTSDVSSNLYTISNISADTYVIITFEEIPAATYTLSIQSGSGGSVSYDGIDINNTTKTYTVAKGASATITITPDSGYRLASLTVNGTDVTSDVSSNQYTIRNITADTYVIITFEEIPAATYTLSIQSGSGGSVSYEGTTITNTTKSFSVTEGSNATITISSNSGYRLSSVTVNGTNVTSFVSNSQYTISNIAANTSVAVSFEAREQELSQDGISYKVTSFDTNTLFISSGDYSGHVVIPAIVTHGDETWIVTGVADGAFDTPAITAITWNPSYAIGSGAFGNLTNPNLLLYVKDAAYAPANVQNVIANGKARKIVLTDAASGNDFDCPKAFTAEEISYTHHYSMTTGIGECRGWEAIALPFDVISITHESKSGLVPFKAYYKDSPNKPFWLYQLSASGFVEAESIVAYTPYIISMPNNNHYDDIYNLSGKVTFAATNVKVDVTEQRTSKSGNKTFVPTFCSQPTSETIFPLNVDNEFFTHKDYFAEGSHFVKGSRPVCPFEAYMTTTTANAIQAIPIIEDLPTNIQNIPFSGSKEESTLRIYNLSGQAVMITDKMSLESALNRLPNGVYIVNGKKVVIK